MFDARSNTPCIKATRPLKVRYRYFTSRPFFIFTLAFVFLVNSIGGGFIASDSWAASASSELTSVGPDRPGSPTPLKELNADTFTIPPDMGYVQDATRVTGSTKTIIHIQDAHCNYAAQKSIANILRYLTNEYGIYEVNCEGGEGGYDLSVFTDIEKTDIREKTSDFFVREGVVNAAEYFAVNNPRKVKLWGIEDADLYIKNLKVYRDSLSHKSEVDRYIKSIAYILNNLKTHIYSSQLLEFDKYYTGYKGGSIPFKEYMTYLIMAAQKKLIDIKKFSDIYLLSQTLQEEDRVDFKKADNEKDEVVDKLKKILSKKEIAELMVKVNEMKSERISQSDFYAYLMKKAKSIKLDLGAYPELQKYIVYISLYSAIDRTKITKEVEMLEDRVKESMYENDNQRELGILSKNLALTRNIFNISLTRDDYTYYVEHKASFAVFNYVKFIDRMAPLYKIDARLDKNIDMLDQYRDAMDQFYECSLERDKAFIKNVKFTDHDRPNSIIITGGFHTENLRELFKKENVSYISIMPKFKMEKGYESPYLKRLSGQRTALQNVIDTAIPAVLNLAVVNILCDRLSLRVEGPVRVAQFRLAVAIVAAIMDNRQFILRLNKGLVIKGEKLEEDKFITFSQPEGAETPIGTEPAAGKPVEPPNAALLDLGPDVFRFKLLTTEDQALPSQITGAEGAAGPAAMPSAVKPGEKAALAISEAIKAAGPMYEAAIKSAPAEVEVLRRDSPTDLIGPVAKDTDLAGTTNINTTAARVLGSQGHQITQRGYVAEGDWRKNLTSLLERSLPAFVEKAMKEKRARMGIRVIQEEGVDSVREISDWVTKFIETRYPAQSAYILPRIKFIPVSIENVEHINTVIDMFTDIGMLEIDRYISGDYESRDVPLQLRESFLGLLASSITNFEEVKAAARKAAEEAGLSIPADAGPDTYVEYILKAIFNGQALRIKPVDWKSIEQWKKAQDEVLKAL